jgi:hypothetical protein
MDVVVRMPASAEVLEFAEAQFKLPLWPCYRVERIRKYCSFKCS